jgi:epoxyqueuosine reductase QueG
MRNWIIGCDICQEACPVNHALVNRRRDPRAGYDPAHHASHALLEGVAPVPRLVDLLDTRYADQIRRNAAIALGNVGRGQPHVIDALRDQLSTAGGYLAPYVQWALEANQGQNPGGVGETPAAMAASVVEGSL